MNSSRQVVWIVGLSAMVTLLWVSGAAQTPSHSRSRFEHVVDLTHALDEGMPYIPVPNTFPFKKTPIASGARSRDDGIRMGPTHQRCEGVRQCGCLRSDALSRILG